MTVSEFALLKLKNDSLEDAGFVDFIKNITNVQDAWVGKHQSHLVESGKVHSTMYSQQDPNDPHLLITAKWDSPEGHSEWIESKDNQTGMSTMLTYLATDPDAVLLFHMTPAGKDRGSLPGDDFAGRIFKVGRVSVDQTERAALERDVDRLDANRKSCSASGPFWAGWRIEKLDDKEVLVMFWDPLEREEPIQELLQKYRNTDVRSFRGMF